MKTPRNAAIHTSYPETPPAFAIILPETTLPGNLSVEQILLIFAGILAGIAVLTVVAGVLLLRRAPRQAFFLLRQQTAATGWRVLIVALALFLLAGSVRLFGGNVVFQVISPTPSITLTPSVTFTPSITFTPSRTLPPTITQTASKTFTPTPSPTPFVPFNIEQQFTSNVTPDPLLRVGPLTFARALDPNQQPVLPATVFFNPIQKIVFVHSYENVNLGVQWTMIWYRNGELFFWDSEPWGGPAAGFRAVTKSIYPDFFLPGTYVVEIFAGREWKQSGAFDVVGAPPNPTFTVSPSITRLPSQTSTPTRVKPVPPTSTATPSRTP
jgi:hypothetical protein